MTLNLDGETVNVVLINISYPSECGFYSIKKEVLDNDKFGGSLETFFADEDYLENCEEAFDFQQLDGYEEKHSSSHYFTELIDMVHITE